MSKEEKSKFQIDAENLDEEWLIQAQLAYSIHKRVAECEFELADAKRAFELTESTVSLEMRDKFAFEKVTEGKIRSEVIKDERYQAEYQRENEAQKSLSLAKAAATAIEHKKRALEHLVSLRKQEYYSNPVTPTEPRQRPAGIGKQK